MLLLFYFCTRVEKTSATPWTLKGRASPKFPLLSPWMWVEVEIAKQQKQVPWEPEPPAQVSYLFLPGLFLYTPFPLNSGTLRLIQNASFMRPAEVSYSSSQPVQAKKGKKKKKCLGNLQCCVTFKCTVKRFSYIVVQC